ncbi:SpoIIE family protein phosphatase [Crocinitomix catalasitica]|nr:SpoIIE family protein phosphatase [Crocinitomix catalasitica]
MIHNQFKLLILSLCCLSLHFQLFGQERIPNKLNFDGLVYGYHNDPGKFLGKTKKIELEGLLSDVRLEYSSGGKVLAKDKTSKDGFFKGTLDLGKRYTIHYTKDEYAGGSFIIDLRNIPEDIVEAGLVFDGMELILNEFITGRGKDPSLDFGKLYYDNYDERFKFSPSQEDKKDVFVKRKQAGTPNQLMQGSVLNNRSNNTRKSIEKNAPIVQKPPRKVRKKKPDDVVEEVSGDTLDEPKSVLLDRSKFSLKSMLHKGGLTMDDIAGRESEISDAWKELEKDKALAITAEDSLIIKVREELLLAAESELVKAKEIIQFQKDQISNQRLLLLTFIGLAVILVGFLFMVYKNYREKMKTNLIIRKKNKRITSSINYASRIQEAILLTELEVQGIIPDSFVYYEPRDTVSGDFYWAAEINHKVIVAAVDCTGHGVPGAFMSMIGNTLLNQIIREKKITEPAEILSSLHNETMLALRQNQDDPMSNQDGMDIAICSIDKNSGAVEFAGAMNPIFVVNGGAITSIIGDKKGVGGGMLSRKMRKMKGYSNHAVDLEKGACLYLFSDGYMDQFGGPEGSEKFNLTRFKEMLIDIHGLDMKDQKDKVDQRLKEWQGDADQVDDILLIGIRI